MANCLILGIPYPHGNTPTVTDNNGNTWPASAAVSADGGVGNYVGSIFVLPSVNSGQTTLTVSFGANVGPFQYTLTEVSNIAASAAVDVTSSAATVSGPNLACGSMTTTRAGDFVWSYFPLGSSAGGNPSNFTAGSGATVLDADIAWVNNQGFLHASQWQIQSSAGSVNPSMTATAGTGSANSYNCVAVALKASGGTPQVIQHVASSADPAGVGGPAGNNYKIPIANPCGSASPSGLYINKVIHYTMSGAIGAGTWKLQFPAVGNFRIFCIQIDSSSLPISGVTDSESGTWSKTEPASDQPQFWWRKNTTANQNLIVSVDITSNAGGFSPSIRAFDISGADPNNPIDASAGTSTTTANGVSSIAHQPDIAVPTAGDLVLATMEIGQGPGLAVTSPSGAVWDLCTFSGETDMNIIENADACAHLYNAPASTLNFTWTITSQTSNSVSSTAVAIKAALASVVRLPARRQHDISDGGRERSPSSLGNRLRDSGASLKSEKARRTLSR